MRVLIPILLISVLACSMGGTNFRVDVMNPAASLYDEGLEAYKKGDLDSAIRAFKDVVDYYPTNDLADEALYMLANCYYEKGDYVNAYAYYKLYVARFPSGKRYEDVNKRLERLKRLLEENYGGSGNSDNASGNR